MQGEDPASIAQNLNIQWNSVMLYLWQSVLDGVRLDGPALLALSRLSADERQAAFSTFDDLGVERLRLIYEALQETVPYEELHILRMCHVLQQLPGDVGSSDP
ncbi:MAG: helix-turn-helix domain-containing protein [Candidatus Promineofilum sp.]|nr:helix-turn-helix domain-containing protein [Promineifilum sp.]